MASKKTFMQKHLPKPSDAVEAMIKGLMRFGNDRVKWFKLDMKTYGRYSERTKLCYGCAATCTVMQGTGVKFDKETIITGHRHEALGTRGDADIEAFEDCIENLRLGLPFSLLNYYGFGSSSLLAGWDIFREIMKFPLPVLTVKTWKKNLPRYKAFAKLLKKYNL